MTVKESTDENPAAMLARCCDGVNNQECLKIKPECHHVLQGPTLTFDTVRWSHQPWQHKALVISRRTTSRTPQCNALHAYRAPCSACCTLFNSHQLRHTKALTNRLAHTAHRTVHQPARSSGLTSCGSLLVSGSATMWRWGKSACKSGHEGAFSTADSEATQATLKPSLVAAKAAFHNLHQQLK